MSKDMWVKHYERRLAEAEEARPDLTDETREMMAAAQADQDYADEEANAVDAAKEGDAYEALYAETWKRCRGCGGALEDVEHEPAVMDVSAWVLWDRRRRGWCKGCAEAMNR